MDSCLKPNPLQYDDSYGAKIWSNIDTATPNNSTVFDHSTDDPDLQTGLRKKGI